MYLTLHNPGPKIGLAVPNKSAVVEPGDTGQRIGEAVYGVPSAAVPSLKKAIVHGTTPIALGGNEDETHGQTHGPRMADAEPVVRGTDLLKRDRRARPHGFAQRLYHSLLPNSMRRGWSAVSTPRI